MIFCQKDTKRKTTNEFGWNDRHPTQTNQETCTIYSLLHWKLEKEVFHFQIGEQISHFIYFPSGNILFLAQGEIPVSSRGLQHGTNW